jgi:hypothetical protein
MEIGMHPWLKTLRHDLVKRAVWPARDLRDTGGQDLSALRRGLFELTDDEGRPVDARGLWAQLRAQAPAGLDPALDDFEAALKRAVNALESAWPGPLQAVLELETRFEALARAVEDKTRK